ncbi:uncharacterized protein BO95DRAFT_475802 [Aspergillus brunneoviolaceus CBS 621.78]|uniref:Uncharacterized protein n=1 Tax=Aspergillus brunneoviolaceus CBS 621.78 TaxID=1450534 RepID=A0ACD1FZT1_9EURO|nr:hypothetical protein BO95DRAFT_475802 [Aspergillus brunneoviolaceus CBS 621.78]RAH42494.1 hypothetical protein BO95DRAFT_475802 [Aspergillus brunneoviolaceus CBS 621.78]
MPGAGKNVRRRNGKFASCEPCRKDKVRCDHGIPVCSRCFQRDTATRCFYHPAPLTRKSERKNLRASLSNGGNAQELQDQQEATTDVIAVEGPNREPSPFKASACNPEIETPLPAGYLGPTSFLDAFAETRDTDKQPPTATQTEAAEALPAHWAHKVAEILRWLKELPIIEHLVHEYYRLSQSAAIPAPFILNALASLLGDTASATSVLHNTSKRLVIPSTTEGSGFHELFTGRHLRLEIIAIIGALAGKASCFALAHGKVSRHFGPDYQARFPRRMMTMCDTVLEVCRFLTPTNDLTVWLQHESLLLSGLLHGDTSSETWHRLGELSTTLFELGLHRESNELPIFLAETRRRIFAAAYQLDKTVATFLGRPPRISIRHSDCKPPLDLADEILTADSGHLQLITKTLDDSGWSLQEPPVFQRASWIRVRFELGTLREEILELSLRPPSADTAAQLRDISLRSEKTWSSLPKHLRSSAAAWREPGILSVSARLMLTVAHLAHLYDEFLVQRLLLREDSQAQGALLKVSAQILSTVLTLGTYGEAATVDLRRDFIWAILLYGFPSASVLVKALQTQSRTGQPLPYVYAGSRAALIRDLSVFLSHLESIAKTDKVHGLLCERTSKALLQILDEVLESGLSSAPLPPSELGDLSDLVSDDLGLLGDEMDFWGGVDPGIVFDQWLL